MLFLRRNGSVRTAITVLAGLVLSLSWTFCAPGRAGGQERVPQRRDAVTARTVTGVAVGVTMAAVAVPLSLGASTCFGSGDYLRFCRIVFVGSTVVGGGLGALVGRRVRREGPPGRERSIMVGSAIGAVSAFLVSLPLCGQERADNPDLLCGYDGMIEPTAVLGSAAVGGAVGYLLGGGSERLGMRHFGPVPAPEGRRGWAVSFTLTL